MDVRSAAETPDHGRAFELPNVPHTVVANVQVFVDAGKEILAVRQVGFGAQRSQPEVGLSSFHQASIKYSLSFCSAMVPRFFTADLTLLVLAACADGFRAARWPGRL